MSTALLDRLLVAAAASPGEELCGLLLGGAGQATVALPCRNVSPDPARFFEIDPAALIAAHRAARAGGPAVIGHYHSHPTGSPDPSPRDAADAAADGTVWLILGAGIARAWRAVPAGDRHGRFDPVDLLLV